MRITRNGARLIAVAGWGIFCLCLAGGQPASAAAGTAASPAAQPRATLSAFHSEQELRERFRRRWAEEFARRMAAVQASPRSGVPAAAVGPSPAGAEQGVIEAVRIMSANLTTVSPVTSISAEDPVAGDSLPGDIADESITNVQEAGVDEGDIVKARGDTFVILRRGRLFTVSIAGGRLQAIDSINAYPPDVDVRADWYDEMLLAGDRVIVIGYSYGRGGTEVNRFHIDGQGHLSFEDAYHVRSNDYYSSRNYASRRIGNRLILYAPLYLSTSTPDVFQYFPAYRRWTGDAHAPFKRLIDARQVYFSPRTPDEQLQSIHSVTSCDLTAPVLTCTATSVLGPSSRTFYVSQRAVYLWIAPYPGSANQAATPALLYRLPLDGSAPSAVGVSGHPVDQFSFREDAADGMMNVLLRSEGGGDAMWNPERSDGAVALLRFPLAEFGDGMADVSSERYRHLPHSADEYDFHNRFVGDYVLYGTGNNWGRPRGIDSTLIVAPIRGGSPSELRLHHSVERIEPMGRNAVVIGVDEHNIYFSAVELANATPGLGDRYVLKDAAQSETRSHGFFFKPERGSDPALSDGVIGLPISRPARAAYRQLFEDSATVTFVRRDDGRFYRLGELRADESHAVDDSCVASCVDWYGNARPIFYRARAFALMGYELVEGTFAERSIREIARVNFAPHVTQLAQALPAPAPVTAAPGKPAPARPPRAEWRFDEGSDCSILVPPEWRLGDTFLWNGECKDHRASGQGVVMASGYSSYSYGSVIVRGRFLDGRLQHGSIVSSDGSELSGDFRDGVLNGRGSAVRVDGTRESGVFRNGVLHGNGIIEYGAGASDRGNFAEGKLSGHGTRVWSSGMRYEGEFRAALPSGRGTFVWSDGDRYTGIFQNGIEDGHGTYAFANGDVLTCDVHLGTIHGVAVLRRRDGTQVRGEVVAPRPDPGQPPADPVYPPISIRLNEQGRVVVAFHVSADGNVDSPYVLYSSGKLRLDEAALRAMANARRLPATINGIPIAVRTTRSFTFQLVAPPAASPNH